MPKTETIIDKRPRYTKREEEVIIDLIRQYPTNLKYAFEQAAERLGRDAMSISSKWYGDIRKNPEYKGLITTGSEKGFSNNVKNVFAKDGEAPEQNLSSFQILIQDMLKLTKREKEIIKAILSN